MYINAFQIAVMKYLRYNPYAMTNVDCLSLLRKNLQCLNAILDIHFDSIFKNNTHWVYAIKFISQKVPLEIKNKICHPSSPFAPDSTRPTHINQALQQPNPSSGQFQLLPPSPLNTQVYTITSMEELSHHASECYNQFHAQLTANQTPNVNFETLRNVQSVFRDPRRLNLSVPSDLWKKLDVHIQKQIDRIRKEIREEQSKKKPPPTGGTYGKRDFGKQYPDLEQKKTDDKQVTAALATIQHVAMQGLIPSEDISISSTDLEDDPMDLRQISMLRTNVNIVPDYGGCLEIQASFRHAFKCILGENIYAISDGGADSCVLGQIAHVINRTGRYARLIGYDPDTTQSHAVPIVSAYVKSKDKDDKFVILLIHEAPYLAHSNTSLLSEYQIRQYGKIIDSCSTKHFLSSKPALKGTQRFEITDDNYINLVDRGGLMGVPMFDYDKGDDLKYPVIEITSKELWTPYRHRYENKTSSVSTVSTPDTWAAAAALVQSDKSDFRLGRV